MFPLSIVHSLTVHIRAYSSRLSSSFAYITYQGHTPGVEAGLRRFTPNYTGLISA